MADFVDPRDVPGAIAPAQPFVDPRDVSSAGAEIGHAVERGVRGGFGSLFGGALKYPGIAGMTEAGQNIQDIGEKAAANPAIAAQPAQHGKLVNTLAQGGEMAGQFLPAIAAGPAAAPLYGMAGGQEEYEKYLAAHPGDTAGASAAGAKNAMVQGGIMAIPYGKVLRGAGGLVSEAAGFGAKTAAEAGARAITPASRLAEGAKAAASEGAGQVAMMTGSAAGQAAVDQSSGLPGPSPLEAAQEALPAATAASPIGMLLGLLHAHVGPAQAKAVQAALADPKAPPEARAAAVRHVYDAMTKVDKVGADTWAFNAGEALHADKPIGVDDSWTTGAHPSVFPEAAVQRGAAATPAGTEAPEDTMAGEGGGQQQGTGRPSAGALPAPGSIAAPIGDGPFPLTVQHGDQNAVDANEDLWARRAEHDRLAASGPLGAAAAAGMDSGAVDHMAEQRASEVPPGEPPAPPADGGSVQDQQAQANIKAWSQDRPGVPLEQAQEQAKTYTGDERTYSVVPHPEGGFLAIPDHLITPEVKDQHAGLQSRDQPAPEGVSRMPYATPEVARDKADQLTAQTGREYDVVPHPYARDKFSVQEKPGFTEREQPTGDEHALEDNAASEMGAQPGRGEGAGRPDEGGGVGRGDTEGLARGQATEAAGEKGNTSERLLEAGVAESHLQHFAGKANEDSIRWGLREPTPKEAAGISDALSAHEALNGKSGETTPLFNGAKKILVFDKVDDSTPFAQYMPHTGEIALRSDFAQADNNKMRKEAMGHLLHEGGHALDQNRDGSFRSATHDAFEIKTSSDGTREGIGGIIKEASKLFLHADKGIAGQFLKYPFLEWDKPLSAINERYKQMGLHGFDNEQEVQDFFKTELFAQLVAMHQQFPNAMKLELPLAHAFIEELHNELNGAGKHEVVNRVSATFRALGAEGGIVPNERRSSGRRPDRSEDAERSGDGGAGAGVGERPDADVKYSGGAGRPGAADESGKHVVNIGLDTNDGKGITKEDAIKALERAGVKVTRQEVRKSNTEQTLVASLDRPLTPKEAHQVAVETHQEAIAQKSNGAGELYGPGAEKWKPYNDDYFLGHTNAMARRQGIDKETGLKESVAKEVAGIKDVAKHLMPAEREKLNRGSAKALVDFFGNLAPDHLEMGAAALAGVAKKGWYREGVKAFVHVFGPDAPRFAALMGALSPRNTVEDNLRQSLAVWRDWLAAGRPTSHGPIFKILNENARSTGPEGTMMNARVPNALRALTAEDPSQVQLSGPKVSSFYKNLTGDVHEVTNDGWMAAYASIDANMFGGQLSEKTGDPGKGTAYLAMSALTRKTAKYLTQLTGEDWSPAEVQETVWSWAKTLYETADARGESRSMVQLIKDKAITDELIKSTPDFRTLLHEDTYAKLLDQAGYGEQLRSLKPGADHGPASGQGSKAGGKATPAPNEALLKRAAARLDQLREDRRTGGADATPVADRPNINDEHGNPYFSRSEPVDREDAPAPTFYSAMTKAITEKAPFSKDGRLSAQMLRNWLASRSKDGTVKRDEIAWTGLDDWLKMRAESSKENDAIAKLIGDRDPKVVTRAEIQQFLDQHGVKVEEKMLGDEPNRDLYAIRDDDTGLWEVRNGAGKKVGSGAYQTSDGAHREIDAMSAEETKYAAHQLPGGNNYRELLLTLPTRESRNVANQIPPSQKDLNATFKSLHFDEPNILAHVRFNERTDANGKRVLFVEEFQSDFAQKTRKEKSKISEAVDNDFQGIVDRMKKAGVLEVKCD